MKYIIYYDKNGEITQVTGLLKNSPPLIFEEYDYIITDDFINIEENYIKYGQIIKKPIKPSKNHIWNSETKVWEHSSKKEIEEIKRFRERLLNASDWTQLPDVPLDKKESWKIYRQALRDITQQEGFPENIMWPKPPE